MADIDFGALAQQALAPPATSPPLGSNVVALRPEAQAPDYDGLAGQLMGMQHGAAVQNLVDAQGSNPDRAAKALSISRQTGMAQPAVEENLDQASESADLQKNVQTLKDNPGLSAFVASNPMAARIAQDDFDKLGIVEKLTAALKSGASSALLTNQLGREGSNKQAGEAMGVETPGTDAKIASLQTSIDAQPKLTGPLGTVQNFTGFLTGLVDNAIEGGTTGALAGALVGAGAGAAAGGVGAIPGAVAGAGIGGVSGFNVDMARVAAGNAYLKMGQMRGADGQPLSEGGKQFGAIFTGAATYALGTYAAGIESKLMGETAESLAQSAIAKAVQTPTFARAVTQFAGSTAKGAAQGAAVMSAMEASGIIGEEIAKVASSGDFKTDPGEIIDRLADAAINGAVLLGTMHAGMKGLSLYGDTQSAIRAQGQAEMFKNILTGAEGSKLRERDLQGFQEFMQHQTDGTPVENLYLPADKVRELYQGARFDPSRGGADPIFGFVPDMAKQLSEVQPGGDVVIPTADFVAHLAGTPIAEHLMPDLRVGADAMSVNEAKAFQKEYAERLKQATEDAATPPAADSAQKISEDVQARATAAGYSETVASKYGAIYAARYAARAERRGLGEDAHALYESEGPLVQKGSEGASHTPGAGFRDLEQPAYHGTAHEVDKFTTQKIGSGEGAQAYGWGMYFAKSKDIAEFYRKTVGEQHGADGKLYKVEVPEDHQMLDLHSSIGDQSPEVKAGLEKLGFPAERVQLRGNSQGVTLDFESMDAARRAMKANNLDGKPTAVPNKMTGAEVYKQLTRKLGGAEAASRALNEAGVPGLRYLDAGSRGDKAQTKNHNFVIFDDGHVGQPEAVYHQGERGAIRFSDSRAVISLFAKADSSTLIHESGHAWLEELAADSVGEQVPAQLRDDMATVREWLGNDGGEFTTEQHEQFARAAEAYLMEGKAPSTALARVFSRFKQWLTQIYRTVSNLDTPINDDIRGVFDRLLATDDELAQAKQSTGLEPNFKSREDAGMTAAEWSAYTSAIDRANQQAESAMLDKTMAKIRRQRTAEYREERARAVEEATKEIDARPDVDALNALRGTKVPGNPDNIKLSAEELTKVYGKEGLADMPKGTTAKGGNHPDLVAEMLGFDSGDALVKALQGLEKQQREIRGEDGEKRGIRKYLIDQAADLKMEQRAPDALDEASIREEAVAAIHSEKRAELLAQELRYLKRSAARALEEKGKGRKAVEQVKTEEAWKAAEADLMAKIDKAKDQNKIDELKAKLVDVREQMKAARADERVTRAALREAVGVSKPMLDAIRAHVDSILEGKTTEDIGRFDVYLRDERKAAREVQQAILKKDWNAAAAAKQRQILSHVIYTRAKAAADVVERGTANMTRLVAKKTFKTIDQQYTNQIHDLLERFGFDSGRGEELQRTKGGTLEQFVKDKAEESGVELAVDPALYTMGGKDVRSLTYAEFKALDDAVRSMQTLGRDEKTMIVDGQRVEIAEVKSEIVAAIRALGERAKSDFYDPRDAGATAAWKERLFGVFRGIDASLTKPEALFDQIDKGDAFGIMNRAIFRRLKEAQGREDRWQQVASDSLKAAVDAAGKDWRKRMDDVVPDDPALTNPETGRPMKLTRKRMLSMALNWGNEGNRAKLADGYKWSPAAIKAFLDRNMSKPDWDFTQKVWGMFDAHKNDLDELQRRVTGVGLDLVHADGFTTPHGAYDGGYYPIVYDAAKSFNAETHAEKATDAMFPNGYTRATTPKGSTITRVEGVKRPIQLSLDVAPWKIGQVIHDLAFREAIIDADRLLSADSVKKAMDEVFGPEYRKMMRPWLKHIANSRNIDDAAIGWIDKAISTARTNTVIVGIGFRLSTMFKHGFSALSNSFKEVGPEWMLKGTAEFYRPGKLQENWDFITGKSAEMKFRMNAYDKDVASQYSKLLDDSAYTWFQKQAQHFGHLGVSYLDLGSAAPTWLGAYRKAMAGGLEDADAVYVADKTVRNAHGAQGITDTAQIQRAKGAANLINMFYGFFNHIYNRQRTMFIQGAEGVRNTKAGEYKAATKNFADVLATSFWYLAVPALIEALASHGTPNENKDEGWGEWAGKAILAEVPAGIPVIRDIAKAAIEGRDYEISPIAKAITDVLHAGHDISDMVQGNDPSTSFGKHVATGLGYLTGLPTAAPFTAGKFLWDINTGDADPQSLKDWYQGLSRGKVTQE